MGCSLFFLVIAYFYFPETTHKPLEEIASAFGDRVVTLAETEIDAEQTAFEGKGASGRVEMATE